MMHHAFIAAYGCKHGKEMSEGSSWHQIPIKKELVSSSKLQSIHDSEIKMQSQRHDDLKTYLHRMSGKNPKNYQE